MREQYPELYKVYDIFIHHFGEDRVDLQLIRGEDPVILVYWPLVTVTNEFGRSIDITDLYAKVQVTTDGYMPALSGGFLLNRSSYTFTQFAGNYMHSHIRCIPTDNFSEFMQPCLGRGPINGTISALKNTNDEVTWMLFCQELDMYVTVESIAGVPYHKLENLGTYTEHEYVTTHLNSIYSKIYKLTSAPFMLEASMEEFVFYYLKHNHLNFNFINNAYTISNSAYDCVLDVSNAFIDFCNTYPQYITARQIDLINSCYMEEVYIKNRKFYTPSRNITRDLRDAERYRGSYICTFKGQTVRLTIDNPTLDSETPEFCRILSIDYVSGVIQTILRTINYKYKNECSETSATTGGENSSTPTYKRTIYL